MKIYDILVLLLLLSSSCRSQNIDHKANYALTNPDSKRMKLVDGHWFNGETFEKKTVWLDNGLIYFKKPGVLVDTIVDLANQYIIPPFAEAHNHNLESSYGLDKRIASYLENGVFYVKLLSSIKKRIAPLMKYYNKPKGIDISMAHAPLTGSGGHPIALRKIFLEKGYFDGLFTSIEEIEFHGYVRIDSELDLEHKWDSIISFEPDFIKLNLLYSEVYEARKNDTTYFGRKGLNPELIPSIVAKAHSEGLRVSAHVETAHDFHVAVTAGVDEIAHLPELKNGKAIAKKDALLAKEKDIVLVTTVSLVTKRKERPEYNALLQNITTNLELLKSAGVTLALGSDMYNDNSTGEFQMLRQFNVFSNLELLKMWTENATATIFPQRKLGKLREGYEASFLVLKKNPISDIEAINENITLRVKQGVILN